MLYISAILFLSTLPPTVGLLDFSFSTLHCFVQNFTIIMYINIEMCRCPYVSILEMCSTQHHLAISKEFIHRLRGNEISHLLRKVKCLPNQVKLITNYKQFIYKPVHMSLFRINDN